MTGDWRDRAGCVGHERPDIWFAVGRDLWTQNDRAEAKHICQTECPVRDECLQWALDTDQRHGIWGGHDEDEREALLTRAKTRRSTA